MNEWS